jgi:hypothetical protein
MSCVGELPKLDASIFSDTGWEPTAVYAHLDWLRGVSESYGIPLYRVSAGDIRSDALHSQVRGKKTGGVRWASMPYYTKNKDGTIGAIRRQCTKEYKIVPIEKKLRELVGYKPRQRIPAGTVEQWFGISLDESQRARVSQKKWIDFHYPLILDKRMTRVDCKNWYPKHGYPVPPRSACVGCPFHSNDEWRNLRDNDPVGWADAVEFDEAIRHMGGMRGEVFLHRDAVPLDDVDLSTPEDHGQLGFNQECMGMCGV